MDHPLVGVGELQRGGFDGVHITNQVGNTYVWRSQLLYVALVAVHPVDGRIVTLLRNQVQRVAAQWLQGIIVKVATSNDWHILVQ